MVRRISHILIAALLLISTTGFTIHQHYCMGNLVETRIFHEPEFCCGEGANCCKNTSETYQLEEDFDYLVQLIDFQDVHIFIPVLNPLFLAYMEIPSKPLKPFKPLHPPDIGTVLARLQVFCL